MEQARCQNVEQTAEEIWIYFSLALLVHIGSIKQA